MSAADGHRSRQLASADLATADLVLAMAREHVEYVRRRHPAAAARTGTLKRLARDLPARRQARSPSGWRRSTSPTSSSSRGKTSTTRPAATPEVFHDCAVEIHELLELLRPVWEGVAA